MALTVICLAEKKATRVPGNCDEFCSVFKLVSVSCCRIYHVMHISRLLATVSPNVTDISQGSVATQ